MTVYEIKNLIHGVEGVVERLSVSSSFVFEFYGSEGFFGLKFEVILEDSVVEVELWINVGIQTKGKVYGYDEGVRFVTNKDIIIDFLLAFKDEKYNILCRYQDNGG